MQNLELSILLALVVFSLIFAFWRDRIWQEQNPSKLGFKWGYFTIANTFIVNSFLAGAVLVESLNVGEEVLVSYSLAGLIVTWAIAYFACRRHRWALVFSTLLSFNPLWILINIFYLKNRWQEFKSESAVTAPDASMVARLKALNPELRIALFCAIAWSACVTLFVFIFQPYGGWMNDDDRMHMLGVIFLPILASIGLRFLFKLFFK